LASFFYKNIKDEIDESEQIFDGSSFVNESKIKAGKKITMLRVRTVGPTQEKDIYSI
jgi:hypothetical protein